MASHVLQKTTLTAQQHSEVIKLVSNFLLSNNYKESFHLLLQKSSISYPPLFSLHFESDVLSGNWTLVHAELQRLSQRESIHIPAMKLNNVSSFGPSISPPLTPINPNKFHSHPAVASAQSNSWELMQFLVYEEHYLELLEDDQVTEAVALLRQKLSTFRSLLQDRVNRLSCAIIENDLSTWRKPQSSSCSGRPQNRLLLLNRLRYLAHSQNNDLLNPHRLSHILDLGMQQEMTRCVTHGHEASMLLHADHNITYMHPHSCQKMHLPSQMLFTLPRMLYTFVLKFSQDGKYLAAIQVKEPILSSQPGENISRYELNVALSFVLYEVQPHKIANDVLTMQQEDKAQYHRPTFLPEMDRIQFEAILFLNYFHSLQWNDAMDRIAFLTMSEVIVFSVTAVASSAADCATPVKATLLGRYTVHGSKPSPVMCFLPDTHYLLIATHSGNLKVLDVFHYVTLVAEKDGTRMLSVVAMKKGHHDASESGDSNVLSFVLYWADINQKQKRLCTSEISLSSRIDPSKSSHPNANENVAPETTQSTAASSLSPTSSPTAIRINIASVPSSNTTRNPQDSNDNEDGEDTSDDSNDARSTTLFAPMILPPELLRDSSQSSRAVETLPVLRNRLISSNQPPSSLSSATTLYDSLLRDTYRQNSLFAARLFNTENYTLRRFSPPRGSPNPEDDSIPIVSSRRALRQGIGLHVRLLHSLFQPNPSESSPVEIDRVYIRDLEEGNASSPQLGGSNGSSQARDESITTIPLSHVLTRQDNYQVLSHPDDNRSIHQVVLTTDCRHLYTTYSRMIRKWNATSGVLLLEYNLTGCPVNSRLLQNSLSFSPRSEYIAALTESTMSCDTYWNDNMQLVIWNVTQSRPLHIHPLKHSFAPCIVAEGHPFFLMRKHLQVLWHPTDPSCLLITHKNGDIFLWGNDSEAD